MPFIKPQYKTYKVIAVGEKISEFDKLLSRHWSQECGSPGCQKNSSREEYSYIYSKHGTCSKVNIWLLNESMRLNHVMPNFYRGSHLVLILSQQNGFHPDFTSQNSSTNGWVWAVKKYCPSAKVIHLVFTSNRKNVLEDATPISIHDKQNIECHIKLNCEKSSNSFLPDEFLPTIHQHLFTNGLTSYRDLESELSSVNLMTDKMNLTNYTRCFERNGIA